MEPKEVMKKSIKVLLKDVARISEIVNSVQAELKEMECKTKREDQVLTMEEQLSEVHTRLEGIRDFIIACQNRVNRKKPAPEDIDVWL